MQIWKLDWFRSIKSCIHLENGLLPVLKVGFSGKSEKLAKKMFSFIVVLVELALVGEVIAENEMYSH